MRSLARFLKRFAFDSTTRRAIDETMADWVFAIERTRPRHARLMHSATTAAALLRVVIRGLARTGEEHPMRDLGRDWKYAIRRLRRAPMFTLFAVVTLAVGIGATTAISSVVRACTRTATRRCQHRSHRQRQPDHAKPHWSSARISSRLPGPSDLAADVREDDRILIFVGGVCCRWSIRGRIHRGRRRRLLRRRRCARIIRTAAPHCG